LLGARTSKRLPADWLERAGAETPLPGEIEE